MGTFQLSRRRNFDPANVDAGFDLAGYPARFAAADHVTIGFTGGTSGFTNFADDTTGTSGGFKYPTFHGADYAQSDDGVFIDLSDNTGGADVSGGRFADILVTGTGTDTLRGGFGRDLLDGGDGADMLDGGSNSDTVTYALSSAAVTIDLTNGTGAGGRAEGDALLNIENVIGSSFDDVFVADGNGNRLSGGDGIDTVRYDVSGEGVNVNLLNGRGTGGDAEGDLLQSIENLVGSVYGDVLIGGNGNNVIFGGFGNDILGGGAGSDTLYGEGNNDDLDGGTGDDFIYGGAGDDTMRSSQGVDVFDGGDDIDTVTYSAVPIAIVYLDRTDYLGVQQANGGSATGDVFLNVENVTGSATGNDQLTGTDGNNRLLGQGGNDKLFGKAGNDALNGGDGDDQIHGGKGVDTLTGGAGADRFFFETPLAAADRDRIADFVSADDQLVVSKSAFGLASNTKSVLLFQNADGSAAGTAYAGPVFLYDNDGANAGNLYFDGDGVGAQAAVLFVTLAGTPTLTQGDFTLVA